MSVARVNNLCTIFNVGSMTVTPSAWSTTLPIMAEKLASDVVAAAQPIDHEAARSDRAGDRVIQKRAPAARKGEYKDALIVEELIELTDKLRSGGFSNRMVFLTSNTTDFCEPTSLRLHPQLAAEFGPLDIRFAHNWETAQRQLV